MKRILLLLLMFASMLPARTELTATQACGLFNNLKHTQNSGSLFLEPGSSYEVLQHHKGQYLLKLPGKSPAQRWVDDGCLASANQPKAENSAAVSQQNLLALSWHNAFCETHRYRKECKTSRNSGNFTLHGLWPQPKGKVYCGVPKRYVIADREGRWHQLPEPKLTAQTYEKLLEVMPGAVSNLHRHEWIKHGTCYGTDEETYFTHAIALAQEVRRSAVARLFRTHAGKRLRIEQVRKAFDQSFGRGIGSRVELRCQRGMITEVWLHLGKSDTTLAQALKEGGPVKSRCRYGIVDRAGYGR